MKKLYTPWRSDYAKDNGRSKKEDTTQDECVFCTQFAQHKDADYFILHRTTHAVVMLAKYPYNAGHLIILPHEHRASLEQLGPEGRQELIELANRCVIILKDKLHAQGVNVGLNLGKIAGAGIPSHLHMHVVPRFEGDTNFLPIIADTKPISFDLCEIYNILKDCF